MVQLESDRRGLGTLVGVPERLLPDRRWYDGRGGGAARTRRSLP